MKVLIWLGYFFLYALIETLLKSKGILLGAIPTIILFSLTTWAAKSTCKAYEFRKPPKSKQKISLKDNHEVADVSTTPKQTEQYPTLTTATPPASSSVPQTIAIEQALPVRNDPIKECTFFSEPNCPDRLVAKKKHRIFSTATSIICSILTLSIGLNVYLLLHNSRTNTTPSPTEQPTTTKAENSVSEDNQGTIDKLMDQKEFYKERGEQLEETIADLTNQIEFYKGNSVICANNDPIFFHTSRCENINLQLCTVLAYSGSEAIKLGKHPCPNCHGSGAYIVLDTQNKTHHWLDCQYLPDPEYRMYISMEELFFTDYTETHGYNDCTHCP